MGKSALTLSITTFEMMNSDWLFRSNASNPILAVAFGKSANKISASVQYSGRG